MANYEEFLEACLKLVDVKQSYIIATLIDKKNSVPQEVGSKMIVTKDGLYFGTIGGGALEKNVIDEAKGYLDNNQFMHTMKEIHLTKDLKMSCGGSTTVFFEKINFIDLWKIVIFGAGHVSQALCNILVSLECKIKCIDTRKEWLDKLPKCSKLETVLVDDYNDYVDEIDKNSFIVVVTSSHNYDYKILKEILPKNYPYIGVLGSNSKRAKFDKSLKIDSIEGEFFCPMGEKIGTNKPNEIAISVVAQLLKYRDL
jgi:xanthine dehydrogenase accessory factor